MDHAGFDGPWTEPVDIATFRDGYRAVLMPAEGPVARVGFLEQQGAHGPGGGAEIVGSNPTDDAPVFEQFAEPAYAAKPRPGALDWNICKDG